MILALLAALAVQQPLETTVSAGRIEIPPRLAPAVVPYLQCTNRAHNEALRLLGGTADRLQLVHSDMLGACAAIRARGLEEGERLLRRDSQFRTADERRAHVEASLRSIEQSYLRLHGSISAPGQTGKQ